MAFEYDISCYRLKPFSISHSSALKRASVRLKMFLSTK